MPPVSPDAATPEEDPKPPFASPDGSEKRAKEPATPPETHELPYREELRRKALHLLALALPLGVALLGREAALLVLIPAALFALSCDVLRSRSRRAARVIQRVFGRMMRADEWAEEDAADRYFGVRVNGATWTLVTMALLTLFFPVPVAVAAFALFMVGDAAAALVGRRYGRTLWGNGPRTVEGTAAFVGAAGLVVAVLAGAGYLAAVPWSVAALAVALAAGAEALPRPFNDNLRVPFVAALTLHLLA